MLKTLTLVIGVLVLGLGNIAFAGDAAAGKEKSVMCAACHGADGIATQPIYPNLAGQQEEYLVMATKAYRDGVRDNELMKMFLMSLTDDDIANLAAYFSSLK